MKSIAVAVVCEVTKPAFLYFSVRFACIDIDNQLYWVGIAIHIGTRAFLVEAEVMEEETAFRAPNGLHSRILANKTLEALHFRPSSRKY